MIRKPREITVLLGWRFTVRYVFTMYFFRLISSISLSITVRTI
ncbi:unnamed protein product [Schistosoma mattheei]|uniref:Uncharacterized protein n=1 Tax=Schistosoma mattheei TaxID=31246 RepID=A0A183Q3D1_9TREM|nr:unnamed protein product [Schistosoma mattheei]